MTRYYTYSTNDSYSSLLTSILLSSLTPLLSYLFFFFNDTATTEIYTLSLHDALPISPSYVSPAYHLLEGFPFIQEPPSGDLQERVLIRHHDYDQCFQSVQLLQWNSQVKFNVTVYRNLPTTRDSIMTS